MSFSFDNKIIYLISPERWGSMKISKHHYALELANRGCSVYFIEPPSNAFKGISIVQCSDRSNIKIVRYKPIVRGERFLPSFLFNILIKQEIKRIKKKIKYKPDVLWCFQGSHLQNLKSFGATLNIFFATDQFEKNALPPEVYSSDILFSVSDTIHNTLLISGKPAYMIGHGLHMSFVKQAETILKRNLNHNIGDKLVAGYVGNLRMEALDRKTMMEVIRQNPGISFIFWGSFQSGDLNLGGNVDKDTDLFISFLQESANVELRGVLSTEMLQYQMTEADFFWICWDINKFSRWDGSNSHKILEYLSTGKPVVSHYVSTYKDSDLLYMLHQKVNTGYLDLFKNTVNMLKKGEGVDKISNRLKMARVSGYKQKLTQIEEYIQQA